MIRRVAAESHLRLKEKAETVESLDESEDEATDRSLIMSNRVEHSTMAKNRG
jgi:hypothetical protein